MSKYDDFINMPRPKSKRQPMSLYDRAAQFAPFAALVGYDSLIQETGRLVDQKIELDDSSKDEISKVLFYIDQNNKQQFNVKVIYFVKDEFKKGGKYLEKTGIIKKIDVIENKIYFIDKSIIMIDDLISIEII